MKPFWTKINLIKSRYFCLEQVVNLCTRISVDLELGTVCKYAIGRSVHPLSVSAWSVSWHVTYLFPHPILYQLMPPPVV